MAEKISSVTLPINKNTENIKERFSFLSGEPYTIVIEADSTYLMKLTFNFANNYLMCYIEDSGGNLVQGDTFFADYPSNLLVAECFKDYACYYRPLDSVIEVWKIDNQSQKFYNNLDKTYDEYLEMLRNGEVY